MMSIHIKRYISIFAIIGIVFVQIFGINGFKHLVNAQESIYYFDEDGNKQNTSDATLIPAESGESLILGDGSIVPMWYYVDGDKLYDYRIIINGAVSIVLKNKSHLNATKGIQVSKGNTLRIFVEKINSEENVGKITATASEDGNAGIGGSRYNDTPDGGDIIISGGNIVATGHYDGSNGSGAGIGGAAYGGGGSFTLNSGTVTAVGSGVYYGNAQAIGSGIGSQINSQGNINLPNAYMYWYIDDPIVGSKYVKNVEGTSVDMTVNFVKIQSLSSNSEMKTFGIDGQIGQTIFDGTNVLVTMPYGTDITTLNPIFISSTGTVVKIENTIQESGITKNNFTNPLTYKIISQDGVNFKDYIVTIRVEKNSVCSIESFKINGQVSSQIDNAKKIITIEMPITNQTSSFAPQIEVSPGATISPESEVEKDFTNDTVYTVTAQDGIASETYNVKVIQKSQWWIDVDGYRVGLTAPAGIFAPGSKFFAREIKYDRDNEEFMRITNDIDLRHKEIYDTIGLYEFTVKNSNDQNYTNLGDYATIRIETKGDFDPNGIEALRIEKTEDVPLEKIRKETINDKIYFTADLNHFSYYALMNKNFAQSSDPLNVETGDKRALWTTIISIIAIISGGGFLLFHKNKKR